jgi:hypothetical protein
MRTFGSRMILARPSLVTIEPSGAKINIYLKQTTQQGCMSHQEQQASTLSNHKNSLPKTRQNTRINTKNDESGNATDVKAP